MIQIQGFASSQNISSLTDEINRWLVSNIKEMDSKFRLIDIKYAATVSDSNRVDYSALVIYEIGETKRTDDSSEPFPFRR